MTRREAVLGAMVRLRDQQVPSPLNDAREMLAHIIGIPVMEMRLNSGAAVTPEQQRAFDAAVEQRLERMPLQYILGDQPFLNADIRVQPGVLIPRQDTESVCEYAIEKLKGMVKKELRALDLCCGTGCIGIAMAINVPRIRVTGTDIDEGCIALSRKNAQRNSVSDYMEFICGDLFGAVEKGQKFDLIVSNPPYIPRGELEGLDKEVIGYEPRLALDGGEDGFDCYSKIIAEAPGHLFIGGYLVLEAGDRQAARLSEMLRSAGFDRVEIFPDVAGNPRGVAGVWRG